MGNLFKTMKSKEWFRQFLRTQYIDLISVINELIINAFDARATEVTIKMPFPDTSHYTNEKASLFIRHDQEIVVSDNGHGMLLEELQLALSWPPELKYRNEMVGPYGVGIFAPFALCNSIEILTYTETRIFQGPISSYCQLQFNEDSMVFEQRVANPDMTTGTEITLSDFSITNFPDEDAFIRQLWNRYGPPLPNFQITIQNTTTGKERKLDNLAFDIDNDTKLSVNTRPIYQKDGTVLSVNGWIGYTKEPFQNALFSGIRVYVADGLILNTTNFGANLNPVDEAKLGSYLVGEIHVDWLSSKKDDFVVLGSNKISWKSELGIAFKNWAQNLVLDFVKLNLSSKSSGTVEKTIKWVQEEQEKALVEIVRRRITAITTLESSLSPEMETDELTLQQHLENAPWLINPRMIVLQSNRAFSSMRLAFERWYESEYGHAIETSAESFPEHLERTRPDFVMLLIGRNIEVVEIKRPRHTLTNEEFNRIVGYINAVKNFLIANAGYAQHFPTIHTMLICDSINLTDSQQIAFDSLTSSGQLEKKTWEELLLDAKMVNQDFLQVYENTETES